MLANRLPIVPVDSSAAKMPLPGDAILRYSRRATRMSTKTSAKQINGQLQTATYCSGDQFVFVFASGAHRDSFRSTLTISIARRSLHYSTRAMSRFDVHVATMLDCSKSKAQQLIRASDVQVNGRVVTKCAYKVGRKMDRQLFHAATFC